MNVFNCMHYLRFAFLFFCGLGILYPLFVTALGSLFFPSQVRGSLVYNGSSIVGSSLIGQDFKGPEYFHGRNHRAKDVFESGSLPSASTAPLFSSQVKDRIISAYQYHNYNQIAPLPVSLVTSSASNLDPHIPRSAAIWQISRISKYRNLPMEKIERLIYASPSTRQLGFLGNDAVNVLLLNIELDKLAEMEQQQNAANH